MFVPISIINTVGTTHFKDEDRVGLTRKNEPRKGIQGCRQDAYSRFRKDFSWNEKQEAENPNGLGT